MHVFSLILSLADLWEGPSNSICQLIIIMFANMFLASRLVCLDLTVGVPGYSSKFQYPHPHKESFPEWISCLAFPHRLRSRYGQRGGNLEVVVVQALSCCPPEPALTGT